MLVDLNDVSSDFFKNKRFDVCITGTGPAGMSLALKLSSKNIRVLLLEAGGLEFSETSQKIYKGMNIGLDYFASDVSRLRYFGGTSNHWGGWSHELNESDFEIQGHVNYSGWPIKKKDLDPYLFETKEILDIETPSAPDYLLVDKQDEGLRNIDFRFSTPVTRFAKKYFEAIKSAENITCVLNANVVDVNLNENLGSVSSLTVSSFTKDKYKVDAKFYVLCMGGIENPRALLNANCRMKVGIGNQNDLVGRFFMEHPIFQLGDVLINYEHPAYKQYIGKNSLPIAFYEPTDSFRKQKKTMNFGLRFERLNFTPPKSPSLKYRLKRNICESDSKYSIVKKLSKKFSCPRSDAQIRVASEQSPNPSSRIKLGNKTDIFGNRKVVVDWRLNELDKHTLRQAVLVAGKIMANKDLGRIKLQDWIIDNDLIFPDTTEDEVAGYHHMGTTRMAESPKYGVVNKDQQVFGIDNLYIGGSSVFSTSGHANPTFTIVQLSLRLADHIANRIKASSV